MEFSQSRFQDVFSRIYEAVFDGAWCFVGIVLAAYLFSDVEGIFRNQLLGLIFSMIISVGIIGYLLLKYKNGSKQLCLNEDKFVYRDGQKVTEFAWQEYQGYSITRVPPYRVIIKDNIYDNTRFSYYAFSPQQRQQIFAILDTKSQTAK